VRAGEVRVHIQCAARSPLELMIARTVRGQRLQSALAPHASATSFVVDVPCETASATIWLVTPLHRHTNIG